MTDTEDPRPNLRDAQTCFRCAYSIDHDWAEMGATCNIARDPDLAARVTPEQVCDQFDGHQETPE